MAETTRHREAFDAYWRLGAERSIERLHEVLAARRRAPTLRTLYEWSRRHRWQDRIARLEWEALLLQQKGTEWLAGMDPKQATPDAAIRSIVEGARLERVARGEPTERQEVKADVEVDAKLAALTDEELDRLIEYAEGTLGREGEKGSR